jgi:hypothetical protein
MITMPHPPFEPGTVSGSKSPKSARAICHCRAFSAALMAALKDVLKYLKWFQNGSKMGLNVSRLLECYPFCIFLPQGNVNAQWLLDLNFLSIAGKGLVSQFLCQHNVKQSQSKLPFPCFPGQPQTKNETFSWCFAGPILSHCKMPFQLEVAPGSTR